MIFFTNVESPWDMRKYAQIQKLRKDSIGGDIACFPECHEQSDPTVSCILCGNLAHKVPHIIHV